MSRTKGSEQKSARSATPPRKYVPVGGVFRHGAREYLVVERSRVGVVSQACIGCDFRGGFCPSVPCSAFDRPDGKFVWFQKVKDEREGQEDK